MSYNVHRCVGSDRRCDPQRIGGIVRDFAPDIAGLQEVDSGYHIFAGGDQVDLLARATGLTAIPGPTIVHHTGTYGNLLLTRHPVAAVRHLDISVGTREPRAALDVDLEISGELVRCIVTHFGLGFRERHRQVVALCELVDRLERPLTVLLGDFNEWVPLRRSLLHLDSRLGRSYGARTFPSRRPVLPLDRMWVRPRHAVTQLWPLRDAATRVASDHLPLCALIRQRA